MSFIAVLVLLGTGLTANCERHSLTYIYTALSKPVGSPGIHEFTAMGLLDGKMIDYFDSDNPKKVPKQDWMKEKLPQDYWDKGTQSCQKKQQWFKVNIDILKTRMRQNDSNLHVLQWMCGCEGDMKPDGKILLLHGTWMYRYNGKGFLSYDLDHGVWVAPTVEAILTKKKWDEDRDLRGKTITYLENDCMDLLNRFMQYEQQQLKEAPPPDVYVYARNTKVEANVVLMCLATGFYPKNIILQIKRNGRVLTKEDKVQSSGVRPNDGDTYQRRDSVDILRSDLSTYTCEVNHPASNLHVEKVWDQIRPPPIESGGSGPAIGGAIGGLIVVVALVAVVLLVLYKKGVIGSARGSQDSLSTISSGVPNGPYTAVPLGNGHLNPPPRKGSDGSGGSGGSSSSSGVSSTGTNGSVNQPLMADAANGQSPSQEAQGLLPGNGEEQC